MCTICTHAKYAKRTCCALERTLNIKIYQISANAVGKVNEQLGNDNFIHLCKSLEPSLWCHVYGSAPQKPSDMQLKMDKKISICTCCTTGTA